MPPLVATLSETAETLRLGSTRVNELVKDGTLKSVKVGRRRLVLRSSIEALLADAS